MARSPRKKKPVAGPVAGPVANPGLTHVDAQGRASMVDVSHKPPMIRGAVAEGLFVARKETLDLLFEGKLPKGDALAVARLAGIQAAKRTDELIPLCHTLPLQHAGVHIDRIDDRRVRVTATAAVIGRTGVEMEALTAVSVACLALYDMTKAVDKNLRIQSIRLLTKTKHPLGPGQP